MHSAPVAAKPSDHNAAIFILFRSAILRPRHEIAGDDGSFTRPMSLKE